MDGVSCAASVAGLAAFARLITREIRKLNHAHEAVEDLTSIIRGFSDNCDAIASLLLALPDRLYDDITSRDPRFWSNLIRTTDNLESRLIRLRNISTALVSHGWPFAERARVSASARWKEQNIQDSKDVARDLQAQVLIMLQVLQLYVPRRLM